MRLVQHKKEAFWFYRFLSIFYDKLVNPLFWTAWMRDNALQLADLNKPGLTIIDVGSGTGFTTQGIVKMADDAHVTCIDQSPHQIAKAKQKEDLSNCSFIIGDAENIPAASNTFDRYISAGSIEYWPDPQKGINESFRIIKPGGLALMIGPLQPKTGFARFMANTWMLFPKEEEYRQWYKNAGFTEISQKYLQPHWYRDKDGYGLAIVGRKPLSGVVPIQTSTHIEDEKENTSIGRYMVMIWRVIIGSTAGFIFIPIALLGYLANSFRSQDDRPPEYREKLNGYQVLALTLIFLIIAALITWMIT